VSICASITLVNGPELQFVFAARVAVGPPRAIGATPEGRKRVVPIVGGTFDGPNIRGTVVAGGADWQFDREDGVTVVAAHYLLETDDGVSIEVRNDGLRHGPAAVMAKLAAGEKVDPGQYYFRAAPRFAAPSGKYDWLNRNTFVCAGARYPEFVELSFYQLA